MLGATSSGGGGNRGGGRGGGGGGADNFNVGQSSGISKTNAAGLNFSNVYGKKLTLSGSYFYNNSANTNESQSNKVTNYGGKQIIENSNSASA
ncbi:MAG: hypothetical protein ACQUYJ_08385, partial [Ferruginibacter sp.]